jgi:hypothetical protein
MANNIDVAVGEFFARFGTRHTLGALARYAKRQSQAAPTSELFETVWTRIAEHYGRAARAYARPRARPVRKQSR